MRQHSSRHSTSTSVGQRQEQEQEQEKKYSGHTEDPRLSITASSQALDRILIMIFRLEMMVLITDLDSFFFTFIFIFIFFSHSSLHFSLFNLSLSSTPCGAVLLMLSVYLSPCRLFLSGLI